jgi:hypothetical protein
MVTCTPRLYDGEEIKILQLLAAKFAMDPNVELLSSLGSAQLGFTWLPEILGQTPN